MRLKECLFGFVFKVFWSIIFVFIGEFIILVLGFFLVVDFVLEDILIWKLLNRLG